MDGVDDRQQVITIRSSSSESLDGSTVCKGRVYLDSAGPGLKLSQGFLILRYLFGCYSNQNSGWMLDN